MEVIVYADKNLLIAYKKANVPTVPLKKKQEQDCLLYQVSEYYPEVLSKVSDNFWEGTAVNRLDTATSGLVIMARNVNSYNYLKAIQNENLIVKSYYATCERINNSDKRIDKNNDTDIFNISYIESYFKSFGKKGMYVKPVFDMRDADIKKLYKTEFTVTKKDIYYLFICRIVKGFRHQIRSHLSYLGYPILYDTLYNPNYKVNNDVYTQNECEHELQLKCFMIELPLENGKKLTVKI